MKRLIVGPSEVLYLVGLVLFFFGLWVWFGLGQALFCTGAVLISTAFANAMTRDSQEQKNVV